MITILPRTIEHRLPEAVREALIAQGITDFSQFEEDEEE